MTDEFYVDGREKAEKPYIYRMSGLESVVLLNGFTRHETEYGSGVSIDHIDQLHDAIALHIITKKKEISPQEFRFLRMELEMTQDELATKLGVNGQTVARYEKGETQISGPADRLIRVLLVLKMIPEDRLRELLEEAEAAAEQDESRKLPPATFRETAGQWEEVLCS